MSEREPCDVCEGERTYPIINRYGSIIYSISCPQCFGSGTMHAEEAEPPEPEDWPPPSTAAYVRSVEDMRAYLQTGRLPLRTEP